MPGADLPPGSEILTSGPVHEAFAKPVTIQHEAGIEIAVPPPANIQETPPAEMPVGASIVWVPGYWAWDAERNDFIWLSGCWRAAPPNMHWVPGYWRPVAGGYTWVAGFWAQHTEAQQQIVYLPTPPAPVEIEPQGQPPLPDNFWVPACWYWSNDQWQLQHGYWTPSQTGWVWVPAHHAWTPRGYVFCPGYWDHDLDNRGVLFSPVYFPAGARGRPDFVFMPNICVDLSVFRLHLFTYPRYHHYYFGDYYDDAYLHRGIYPWFDCQSDHTWYDPIFAYDRWHAGRGEPRWLEHQQQQYAAMRADRTLRPAKTYTEFQARAARQPVAERGPHLVTTLKAHAASQSTPLKFERINTAERQQLATQATAAHAFRDQRAQWETPAAHAAAGNHKVVEAKPVHENMPLVIAHPAAQPKESPRIALEAQHVGHAEQPEGHANVAQVSTHSFAQPKEMTRAALVPPHTVHLTQPERVQIPTPPIVARPATTRYIQKDPPAHPIQEHAHQTQVTPQGRPGADKEQQKKS